MQVDCPNGNGGGNDDARLTRLLEIWGVLGDEAKSELFEFAISLNPPSGASKREFRVR